ncbi:E3 ubiquitin/ISG15 ligase TRIM25 [Anabarilius grahami]|uniref:E3 ubiquitin/ISG15 ligase TRIM25 n=1 Tax=Anabarilius grahami TaxID=495550 RepID=A0A3N0XTL9_ANAGA|nr:E3 ubiquitin/ISG15 ligase TRIM25 [Anabarilius grahami]
MAEARISQDEFMCSVCLDFLKDPVTIHCGHSYCKSCINGYWDQEDQKRVYSCPQCRQTFSPRPALAKNTILDEMVEKLKKIKLPADCYAGAGDVQCDVCTGRKHKAVKSCLVCLESYCQTHFDRHEEFHSRKPHKVTEATGRLIDEHKNHDTVSAAAQRTEKQSFQSLSAPPESTDVNANLKELKKISDRVSFTNIVPWTRNDFLQYSHHFPLDLNTVNKNLRLSERNRVITNTDTDQPYHYHPDRFDYCEQVLCRESVCGRCYWEIEWRGVVGVFVSVSYKSINRKGRGKECCKMTEARISQDEFMCPVCLDLLKDPVTIPCGHSYCKSCITGCWDQEDQMRVYSCPQCRQTFSPRPALAKNTILAEVVEKLKKIKLPADCYAGAGDVQCDVCTGRKHKAVKSCLVCLESYCQNHLEQHESLFKGKRHNLTEATGRLQEMICPKHDKILEVFCRTDQKCICVLCTMDEHKNHNTVSAAAQRTEKQHQLKETQRLLQQRIQQREKDLQQLREDVESHKRSAQTPVEDSERIFTELIRSIERSRSEATQRIRDQEKTAVSRAEGRLERLEQEINDLRRRDAELEQLSHTQDHIHFLQVTEI